MNIREFSLNLLKVYAEMSESFSLYQKSSGLHCLSNCGECCKNPEIEASILEMYPMALRIYDEGKVDEWLEVLDKTQAKSCLQLQNSKCNSYDERPSVCRMFGVAGTFDKHQNVIHSICKLIKQEYPLIPAANETTPLIPFWNHQLLHLHPELTRKRLPINEALRSALEEIAFNASYRSP